MEVFKGSQLPKMKSRFFICPWHKIYKVEAVIGLSLSNYTFKIKIFVVVKFGAIREKLYFVNNCLIKV